MNIFEKIEKMDADGNELRSKSIEAIKIFIYLFIYWARIKKNINDRWCEKK